MYSDKCDGVQIRIFFLSRVYTRSTDWVWMSKRVSTEPVGTRKSSFRPRYRPGREWFTRSDWFRRASGSSWTADVYRDRMARKKNTRGENRRRSDTARSYLYILHDVAVIIIVITARRHVQTPVALSYHIFHLHPPVPVSSPVRPVLSDVFLRYCSFPLSERWARCAGRSTLTKRTGEQNGQLQMFAF